LKKRVRRATTTIVKPLGGKEVPHQTPPPDDVRDRRRRRELSCVIELEGTAILHNKHITDKLQ
jgi:hypothetical protein